MSRAEYYPKTREEAVNVILTDSLPPVADYRGPARQAIAEIVLDDMIADGYEIGASIDGPLVSYYDAHLNKNGYTWDPTPHLPVDEVAE